MWDPFTPPDEEAIAPEQGALEMRGTADHSAPRTGNCSPVDSPGRDETAPHPELDTDLANCHRLVGLIRGRARYIAQRQAWLHWDGTCWAPDLKLEVRELAKRVPDIIRAEAMAAKDKDAREALMKWARSTEDKRRLDAMIVLAQSDPEIVVSVSDLDRNPWLLNVQNGTLCLKTGLLRPHDPCDLLNRKSPVAFEAAAPCRRWRRFLLEIMRGNRELVRFLRRMIGYSLTGDTSERALFIFHGEGKNGKSVLVTVLQKLLGNYALKIQARTLLERRSGSEAYEIADLPGIRFAYASESNPGQHLDAALVKELTGGVEEIAARSPYEKVFRFKPDFKLVISTNHKPQVPSGDQAAWDRLRLIPFLERFGTESRPEDKGLLAQLEEELPGILAWALQGCLEWQKVGLKEPDQVKAATDEYRGEMDAVGAFVADKCTVVPGLRVNASTLYEAFVSWAKANNERPSGRKEFVAELEKRGHTRKKCNNLYWEGIGLSSPETDEPGDRGQDQYGRMGVTGCPF